MNKKEYQIKQTNNLIKLKSEPTPTTQIEKDINNLKFLRYSIEMGSIAWGRGCIKSLDRAIKLLENSDKS